MPFLNKEIKCKSCLLYTSDAADDLTRVDLGGRRIIKKIFFKQKTAYEIASCLVGSEMCIRDSCPDQAEQSAPGLSNTDDLHPLSLIHI